MQRIGKTLLRVARRIGHLQTVVLLTVFYFLILAPVACVYRCFADPLALRRANTNAWHARTQPANWWAWAKAQF